MRRTRDGETHGRRPSRPTFGRSGKPFFDAGLLERGVGVRFKGAEKTNVEEYCVSEGWIRVTAGTSKDRRGRPMTMKLKGPVEVWLKEPGEG